jgi:hypothetical protein
MLAMGTNTAIAAPKAGLRRELGLTSITATVISGIMSLLASAEQTD